jgi:prepilin-type N-terminal cleavage/methylation domain-containing protein
MKINNNKGFTLVEIMVVIILLTSLIAMTVTNLDMSSSMVHNGTSNIMASMSEIEASYGLYLNDKNVSPTGLTDTSFVPIYLMIPNTIQNFDSTYGTSGYVLEEKTAGLAGTRGWYVASRVTCKSTDITWKSIVNAGTKLSSDKYFYNSAVAALSNIAPPAASTTIYVTYWITRY